MSKKFDIIGSDPMGIAVGTKLVLHRYYKGPEKPDWWLNPYDEDQVWRVKKVTPRDDGKFVLNLIADNFQYTSISRSGKAENKYYPSCRIVVNQLGQTEPSPNCSVKKAYSRIVIEKV